MRSVLEDMWYGNLSPQDECIHNTHEIKQLRKIVSQNYDKLCETISAAEKETLCKYEEVVNELNSICERDLFIYAFSLGVRFMTEALTTGEEEL